MKNKKGFTLIELLVVIAIIGILSAVVLASLNTARDKAKDATIQSDLAGIRVQAELYQGGMGANSYGSATVTTCAATTTPQTLAGGVFTEPSIEKAVEGADIANGDAGGVVCNSTRTAYAVSAALVAGVDGNMFWCVDSIGSAKSHPSALGSATVCP
jgi:type IV pilus assembly protein PilA